jgi:tetratricopeptide (TPR) repeat protein
MTRNSQRLACNWFRMDAVALIIIIVFSPGSQSADIDLSDCLVQTEIPRSPRSRDPLYDELRAKALVAAGHYEESIPSFLKCFEKSPRDQWNSAERDCGLAYEKLGKFDEALKHYEKCDLYVTGKQRAALLIKLGRFEGAKKISDQEIQEERARLDKYQYDRYDDDLCAWLELRAAAEDRLHLQQAALSDLKVCALWYAQDNSLLEKQCIAKYNKLIDRSGMGKHLQISASDLPAEGKDSVLGLLKFICTVPTPLDVKDINKFAGSKLRTPGGRWITCDQQDRVSPAFWQMGYRTDRKFDPASALLQITVWRQHCAIDKRTIMAALPARKNGKSITLDWFNDRPLADAEVWTVPSGTLVLQFARSGFRVLQTIEWRGGKSQDPEDPSDSHAQERLAEQALAKMDLPLALEHASAAIAIEETAKTASESSRPLSRYYMERAEILWQQQQLEAAIADASAAVRIGGAVYLPRKVEFLLQTGGVNVAIEDLGHGIATSNYERERAALQLLLAKVCLEHKQYSNAISAAERCIQSEENPDSLDVVPSYMSGVFFITERMSAPAHLIKAKAEAGLGKFIDARHDGQIAADQFFDIAHIACRDKVRDWMKTLPGN